MSLPVLLTSENLRAAAGGAFARGEAYWREGRVLSCVLDKDALDGLVRGTEEYRVRVTALSGTLVSHCTCPVREAVCKHAVALSLSFLAQRGAVLAPLSEEGVSSASEGMFATRPELDRWAEAHHVKHALAVSAGGLLQDLAINEAQRNGLRHVLGGLALRDVGSREGAFRHVGARGRGLETALAEAAAAYLRQEADSVRLALTEEAVRREHHGDALLAPLWGRLLEARRALRLHAVPRSRERRALEAWSFEAAACALTWKERDRVVRGGPDYGTVSVSARLTFPGGDEGRWECNCAVRQRGCVHVLALVDTVLDLLSDTARLADARRLAEELLRPGWARALKELELFEEEAAKPRATVEVWWYIEHELGTLTVSPLVKKQTRRGTLSAGARMTAARLLEEHRESLSDADLRIAEHLVSWAPTSSRAAGTYPSRAFLSLAGHPRVALELRPEVPLDMKRVQLGFTALAADGHIRLEPSIEGERFNPKLLSALLRTFSLGEPLFTVEEQRGRCLLIDVNEEARRIWTVLEKHGDQFPPESHGQLLERLSRLEARLPLVVPQALKGRELQSELATVVRLRLLPDVSLELELLVRPGPGAPLYHPGVGPRDVLLSRGGERGYVRRQLLREEAHARAAIAPLPLSAAEEGPPFCFRMGDTEAALELVAALQSPPAGIHVEWVDEKPVIAASAGPEALRVQVERKRDWFGLSGELKVEAGRLELAVLLDAARRQKRFVRVDAHRWVELSETLRQRLLAVADHSFVGKNRIELSPGAVPAISALRDAGAEVEAAPSWQLLTERLAASLSLKPKPPASLGTTLRDYQVEGHAWLSRVAAWGAGACLADDMGLGKTVQALAVLLDRARLGPALVLAPTSVAFNWVQELQRFAPGLRPVLYAEQAERMACLTKLRKNDVLIVSYGLLVRDAASLGEVQFATLVVDEAQALKNPSTRRARAARQLKAGFRIALSGTPFENHLGELWSLFAIVFPGLLGSWEQFRERFAAPIERGKEPEANASLSRVLRPFLLRRTKQEVARELPSRTEIQVPVALSEEEWTLYEDARLAAVAEVSSQGKGLRDEQQRFQVLAALTRLRLLASHPRLYDAQSSVSSSKMRRLLELLEELKSEGHRALVFSQFTSHLELVREELERAGFTYQYLEGATPAAVRAKRIQAFQDGQGDVFLISLKAGGTGINLTAADYVIHLDPWWNPAVEDQATDRAHRIGQTRPVTVYRLIARGTIEEQILSLHSDKRALVAGVLEGTNAAARLTTKDLLTLLAGGDSVRDMQGDEEEPGPRTVH